MIRLENVSKYYYTTSSVGLGVRKINLNFNKGEFVVITGESGSGKSTLLNVISGLDKYEEGEMYLYDEETSHYLMSDWEEYRAKNIGFVFQNYNIVESYSVLENILLALELQGYDKTKRKERAFELIEKVGLSHRIHHKAGKLSGGEKQRTVIARALAKDARVIVCDEPTGNLDSNSSNQVLSLIKEISKDRLVILVTHNYDEVKDMATRRIRLRDGEIVEDRMLKDNQIEDDFKDDITNEKVGVPTLFKLAVRNLKATPRRLIFVLSLQIVVVGIFLFIYAYLMYSSEILVGEIANETDSSHQLEVTLKDEGIIDDFSDFDNELIKSIVKYETVYNAYKGIGYYEDLLNGPFSLEEINVDDATVLNREDLTGGEFPEEGEIVLNELLMDLYGFRIGDKVILQRTFLKYTRSIGDTYVISGTTIRGNASSVYSNHSIFEDENLAIDGLVAAVGRNINYDYTKVEVGKLPDGVIYNEDLRVGKIIFDDSLPPNEVRIPSSLFGSLMGKKLEAIRIKIGPYYGVEFPFEVDMDDVDITGEVTNNIIVSSSYRDVIYENVFVDFEIHKVILNVHDVTDGKEVASKLDDTKYRMYYDVAALNSRAEIMTQQQFEVVSYLIVMLVGSLLYMILGVVLRNVNKSRNKDFAIYRSMGANKSFLAKLVILEQILSGVLAFSIVVAVSLLIKGYVYQVEEALSHVFFYQYVLLFIISIFLSVQIARRFNKRIFKLSVITSLNNEEEGLL
jgi:ABC-type lipoprotein export system ATPase subunit